MALVLSWLLILEVKSSWLVDIEMCSKSFSEDSEVVFEGLVQSGLLPSRGLDRD